MKTCSECGRSYPDAQLQCTNCSLPLPKGEAADMQTVAHINYLLGELPQWVMAGWLDPKQAGHISAKYQRRRDEALAGGMMPPSWSSPVAPPLPTGHLPSHPAGFAPSPTLKTAPLAAFREDRSLAYWLLMGALLLAAGVLASVIWAWESSSGRPLVFTLLLGLTGGLAALAHSRVVREERITASVLTTIAALLVPVDLFVANAFLLVGGRLTNEGMGLLTSLACLPLYAWLARRASRTFLVLSVLDLSAAVHFLLQALLPSLLHTHAPMRLYGAYGPVYALLAALYLGAATRDSQAARRSAWRALMHVTAAAALAASVATGAKTTFGLAATTLLLEGALYAAAAVGLKQAALATFAVGLTVLGTGLGLAAGHVSPGSHWYIYVLTALAIAFGLRGLSARIQEVSVAPAYARGAQIVGSLAALGQALRVVSAFGMFPAFSFGVNELWGALACAVLSGAFFAWARSSGMRDALLAYSMVLVGLLAAHGSPWAAPGNVGLSLAVGATALWTVRRSGSAQVCGWVALLVCGAYALHGGFLATNSVALLLLVAVAAGAMGTGRTAPAVWMGLAAATLLTLLWESRGLPLLRANVGLEPNNGYGLFLLTVACLVLYARRRETALRQGAAALGIGNAALQSVYAIHGSFPYSPLFLLAAGIALCFGIAWVRGSERFALWTTTLVAYAYVTYVAGLLVGSPPFRETLVTGVLLVSAVALAALAQQQKRMFLTYAAPLVGAVGWAHMAHRLWHPSAEGYSLALLPLIATLYAVAVARARQEDDVWPGPLQNVALSVSVLALLPCLGDFVQAASPGGISEVAASLLLYGLLFAAIAWLRRDAATLYAAAALLNGAYLFGLLHHAPALSRPLMALCLGVAGLAWLGAATLWQRLAAGIAPLFPVAAAVALVTSGLALTDMHGDDALDALLIAGTTFAGIAWGSGQSGWVHVGIWTYLLAYGVWLWDRIGAPGMTNGDYFLIPVGVYVLVLGLLARRGLLDAHAPPFYLAGLLLILTPTYLAARQPSVGLFHALLLAGECLAAIFYGLTARVKVFLAAGTAGLLLWIQLSLRSMAGQGSWAVSALLLGLAIIGSALYLEKRRVRRASLPQASQHEWQRWE